MVSYYDDRVAELLDNLKQKQARATELRRKLDEISASATAPRNIVKVTVNAQGQLAEIEFPVAGYKRMPPIELAKAIMDTARDAADKATEAVRELLTPEMPAGLNFIDMLQGKAPQPDLAAIVKSLPERVLEHIGMSPEEFSGGGRDE
jgi:DNA-binding protein YbaB